MTPELLKEIAQQMRDDNPEATGQMTAASRAAAKAIHALADAMDKVANKDLDTERVFSTSFELANGFWIVTCSTCRERPTIASKVRKEAISAVVATHYQVQHPRAYPALMKKIGS